MSLRCDEHDRIMILRFSGEIDHHRAKELMGQMDHFLESGLPRNLTLDLEEVTFMDSSGIALVLRAHRRIRELGGVMQVVHIPAQAGKVLNAAGLRRMITMEE